MAKSSVTESLPKYDNLISITDRYFGVTDGHETHIYDGNSATPTDTRLNIDAKDIISLSDDVFYYCTNSLGVHVTYIIKITHDAEKYAPNRLLVKSWKTAPKHQLMEDGLILYETTSSIAGSAGRESTTRVVYSDNVGVIEEFCVTGKVEKIYDDGRILFSDPSGFSIYNSNGERVCRRTGKISPSSSITIKDRHLFTYTDGGIRKAFSIKRKPRECRIHAGWKLSQRNTLHFCDTHQKAFDDCETCSRTPYTTLQSPDA